MSAIWLEYEELEPNYIFHAEVDRIIDADTIIFDLELPFYLSAKMNCRLLDVDAPEVRGPEKSLGIRATEWVREWLGDVAPRGLRVRTKKQDKYGRWLADVYDAKHGVRLNDALREHIRNYEDIGTPQVFR